MEMSFWYWFLRNIILPAGDLVYGQKMIGRLNFLEEAQWWDREHLSTHRDQKIKSLVSIAYNEVQFYRNLMDDANVRPDDINHVGDLYKIPIVTKEMLRQSYPHFTTRNTGKKTYEVCSSGSTGANFRVREDFETAGWRQASFLLSLEWAGWKIGEPHIQTGINPKRNINRRLKDFFLRCYYVSAFDLSDHSLNKTLDVLEKNKIRHLRGYPGSLYFLARHALEMGWNQPLQSIVTWGDNLYMHYRKTIEAAFKTRVYDTYGCAEGMQIAAQCGNNNTYHVHMLDVIVEYLDNDGQLVSPGNTANLIITRLHAGPMPLIRYQVGDIGISGGVKQCQCGRAWEVMDSIEGRDTDIVLTPSGKRLIVHFFTGILEYFPQIDSFQVLQEELGSIVLRLVPALGFSKSVVDEVKSQLKEKGDKDLQIDIDIVEEIPVAPSGKRRFVISKVWKSAACDQKV